jgi:type I restriction enzyme M protein
MYQKLLFEVEEGADPEDPEEYLAENVFWVPQEARWNHLERSAKQPTIGKIVDDAMTAIERDNSTLKGVLPKNYAREGLDKQRLGELIDLWAQLALAIGKAAGKTCSAESMSISLACSQTRKVSAAGSSIHQGA